MTSEKPLDYKPGVSCEDLDMILQHTSDDVWQALKNTRIFITGGTGFVGCWLLETLIWANYQKSLSLKVDVLTRNIEKFKIKAPHLCHDSAIKLIQGNVNDLSSLQQNYDLIIHAATDVVQSQTNPVDVYDDIVQGTREILNLAKRCGCKQFLLTSSGAVYGISADTPDLIPENYLAAPATTDSRSAYGQAKRISEWLANSMESSFEVKIARCFALIGPYLPLDAHFAAGNFIRNSLNKENIVIKGDGTTVRSYLYAADMVIWLLTILMKGKSTEIYNLGSDQGISIADLAKKISYLASNPQAVSVSASPLKDGKPQRYLPNIDKAKAELSLSIYTSLDKSIEKTLQWYSTNLSGHIKHE